MGQPMGRFQGAHNVVEHQAFAQDKCNHQHKAQKPPDGICLMEQGEQRSPVTAPKQAIEGQDDDQQQKSDVKKPLFLALHLACPLSASYCNSIQPG